MKMPKNNQEAKSKQELIEKWESAIEAAEFYGKGKEERLISYMEDFVSDLNQLDEPEVLSLEWIEEHRKSYTMEDSVEISDLQNLLVPKQDLPVIPRHVADWWERDGDSVTLYGGLQVKKKHKFGLVSSFHDRGLGDYLSEAEEWIDENRSTFLDIVNGKPYEVEEERKYHVTDGSDTLLCKSNGVVMTVGKLWAIGSEHEAEYDLTEQEIRNYDERFWPFAVKVEGLEE